MADRLSLAQRLQRCKEAAERAHVAWDRQQLQVLEVELRSVMSDASMALTRVRVMQELAEEGR